jgi:hypothetical protein
MLITLRRQSPKGLNGALLVDLVLFFHPRLSIENAFAGACHGSGESRCFN